MTPTCVKSLQNQKNHSKKKKTLTLKSSIILLNGRQEVFNAFGSEIFPKGKQGKIFTSILDTVACVAKVAKIISNSKY